MSVFRRYFAKKHLPIFLLAVIPVALFFVMRAKLSWRPRVLGRVRNGVTALVWSPDGKYVAAASGDTQVWQAPSEIYVMSVQGNGNYWIKISTTLQTLKFTADGNELVGIDIARKLHRWDWRKRVELSSALPSGVLAVSDDAKIAAIAARGGVAIHAVQNGQRIGFLKDPRGIPKVAVFSKDNKKLALFCAQSSHIDHIANSLQIWRIEAGNKPFEWQGGEICQTAPFAIEFWLDQKSVAFIGSDMISVLNSNGEFFSYGASAPSNTSQHSFMPFCFSREHVCWYDIATNAVELQQWPSKHIERQLYTRVSSSALKILTFAPDGATLAGGDDKGFITLWRIK